MARLLTEAWYFKRTSNSDPGLAEAGLSRRKRARWEAVKAAASGCQPVSGLPSMARAMSWPSRERSATALENLSVLVLAGWPSAPGVRMAASNSERRNEPSSARALLFCGSDSSGRASRRKAGRGEPGSRGKRSSWTSLAGLGPWTRMDLSSSVLDWASLSALKEAGLRMDQLSLSLERQRVSQACWAASRSAMGASMDLRPSARKFLRSWSRAVWSGLGTWMKGLGLGWLPSMTDSSRLLKKA